MLWLVGVFAFTLGIMDYYGQLPVRLRQSEGLGMSGGMPAHGGLHGFLEPLLRELRPVGVLAAVSQLGCLPSLTPSPQYSRLGYEDGR